MVTRGLELIALALLVAFGYFVWPPAALLVAGVSLLVVTNASESRRRARARGEDS